MQPSRILPDLQCSLMCEEVRQEANGNFFLVGILDAVRVPQVPVTAFKLSIFNRWTSGLGQFMESVRVIAPDQTTVLRKSECRFSMKDARINATTVTLFANMEFAAPGVYYVEVTVDDVMKLRYPIHVVVMPPPSQQTAPASGAPPAAAPQ